MLKSPVPWRNHNAYIHWKMISALVCVCGILQFSKSRIKKWILNLPICGRKEYITLLVSCTTLKWNTDRISIKVNLYTCPSLQDPSWSCTWNKYSSNLCEKVCCNETTRCLVALWGIRTTIKEVHILPDGLCSLCKCEPHPHPLNEMSRGLVASY